MADPTDIEDKRREKKDAGDYVELVLTVDQVKLLLSMLQDDQVALRAGGWRDGAAILFALELALPSEPGS